MSVMKKLVTVVTALAVALGGAQVCFADTSTITSEELFGKDAEVCKDWNLDDFTIEGTTIVGFSDKKKAEKKLKSHDDTVCFPNYNNQKEPITDIAKTIPKYPEILDQKTDDPDAYEKYIATLWDYRLNDEHQTINKNFILTDENGDSSGPKVIGHWPEQLKSIGDGAFNGHVYGPSFRNPLETIPAQWPPTLEKIEDGAFYRTNLKKLPAKWPDSLVKIGVSAFSETQTIGDNGGLPKSWDKNLTEIDDWAFRHDNLTELPARWPSKLTKIGAYAFGKNSFSSIPFNWPLNLKKVGIRAFNNDNTDLRCLKYVKDPQVQFSEISSAEDAHVRFNEYSSYEDTSFPSSAIENEGCDELIQTMQTDSKYDSVFVAPSFDYVAVFKPSLPLDRSDGRLQCELLSEAPEGINLELQGDGNCDIHASGSEAGSKSYVINVSVQPNWTETHEENFETKFTLTVVEKKEIQPGFLKEGDRISDQSPKLAEGLTVELEGDHVYVTDARNDGQHGEEFTVIIGNKTVDIDPKSSTAKLKKGLVISPVVPIDKEASIQSDDKTLEVGENNDITVTYEPPSDWNPFDITVGNKQLTVDPKQELALLKSAPISAPGVKVGAEVRQVPSNIVVSVTGAGKLLVEYNDPDRNSGKKFDVMIGNHKYLVDPIAETAVPQIDIDVPSVHAGDEASGQPKGVGVVVVDGQITVTDNRTSDENGNAFAVKIGQNTYEVDPTAGTALLKIAVIDAPGVHAGDEVNGLPDKVDVAVSNGKITVTDDRPIGDNGKPFTVTIGKNTYEVNPAAGTLVLKTAVIAAPDVREGDEVSGLPDGLTIAVTDGQITVTDDRTGDLKGKPFEVVIGNTKYRVDPIAGTVVVLGRVISGGKKAGIAFGIVAGLALLTLGLTAGLFMAVAGNGRDLVLKRQMVGAGLPKCLADAVSAVMWKFHKFTVTPMAEDGDTDNDGLTDQEEREGTRNTNFGLRSTNPSSADTDGDGVIDGVEIVRGTDPNVKN